MDALWPDILELGEETVGLDMLDLVLEGLQLELQGFQLFGDTILPRLQQIGVPPREVFLRSDGKDERVRPFPVRGRGGIALHVAAVSGKQAYGFYHS